jgi:hypothetical protein
LLFNIANLLEVNDKIRNNDNIFWMIHHLAISTLSKLIKLNPKKASQIAKMIGTVTIVNAVKTYYNSKSTAKLNNGEKMDFHATQGLIVVANLMKDLDTKSADNMSNFMNIWFQQQVFNLDYESLQNRKRPKLI